ncbi:MAG: hypothetical protein FGM37_10860 [Phycisphaerales bacterium]|nr:hypothetical protein [Phycisphaerales bacterium]
MTRPWISAGLAALASTAAACNSYEQAYSGERWLPASQCSVVLAQPPASEARLIGQSTFVGTDDQIGDAQATDCGRQVGANLVEWDKTDKGSITELESVPVYSGWSWNSGFNQVSIPVPVTKETWRVHARYYRSLSLGGSAVGQSTPSSPPAVPAAQPARHEGTIPQPSRSAGGSAPTQAKPSALPPVQPVTGAAGGS